MSSGYIDLYVDQYSTYNTMMTLVNTSGEAINLSNYTITGNVKKSYITSNVEGQFNITTANSTNGSIYIALSQSVTSNLKINRRYVYDIIKKDIANNIVSKIIEGTIYVTPGVTRDG
jgi:hypothetical protein